MQHETQTPPYQQLDPDCVLDAVEALGFLSDARIFPLNSYENRVYQVGIEDAEPIIAKFYRPHRWSAEQILEEHHFSLELEQTDLPVVPPMVINERTLHEHKGYLYALFRRRGGRAPELDNLENLYILGRTLGRMHHLGATRPFKLRPTISLEEFGHSSRNFLLENRWLPADLSSDYQHLTERLLTLVEQAFQQVDTLECIRLHGDCHPGNILWRDNLPHFVDFDDCRNGPAVQDLWMLLSGDRHSQTLQMGELIEGYEEFHDFNRAELKLVEPLRALRIMHYAAWLARRWHDPTFPMHFPWFNSQSYWMGHLMELRELIDSIERPPLQLGMI